MDNVVIFCAKYLVFAIPLIVAWQFYKEKNPNRIQIAIAIVLAGISAVIVSKLLGHLYSNPRPFISDNTPALISHGNDNGFPSEHTVFAMTLTTILFFYNRQLAGMALIATLLVGWGRVAAHVHHGIDIIAGLAVGLVAGSLGWWLASRLHPSAKNGAADHKGDQPVTSV